MQCLVAYDSAGNICGITQNSTAPSYWDSSWQTLTLGDDTNPSAETVWNSGNVSGSFTVQNGTLVAVTVPEATLLAQSQASQLAAINAGYNAQMNGGFTSNATGTLDTYAIDPESMGKWTGVLAVIDAGNAPATQMVKDIVGNKVTLTQSQFKQFALDGLNFFNTQEQQLWTLEELINTQTSVPATPVSWTPGTYTPQPAPTS